MSTENEIVIRIPKCVLKYGALAATTVFAAYQALSYLKRHGKGC